MKSKNFYTIFFFLSFSLFFYKCENPFIIVTVKVSDITMTNAKCGGRILSDGDKHIISKGICWNSNNVPTINDSICEDKGEADFFSCMISGLSHGNTYLVRAYAITNSGEFYGETLRFSTLPDSTDVGDADGNWYHTIKIGNQIWFASDLRTSKYTNGSPIAHELDEHNWESIYKASYSGYRGYVFYGLDAVLTGRLAPEGWHVANDDDWNTLENYLIHNGYNYDGSTTENKIAKSLAKNSGWETYTWAYPVNDSAKLGTPGNNQILNNSTGFTACPVGFLGYHEKTISITGEGEIGFFDAGYGCTWWSIKDSEPFYREIYFKNMGLIRRKISDYWDYKANLVRCVKKSE